MSRIPKYRLAKSTGRAVVTIDGQDVYLGKFGSRESRQKYDAHVAKLLARRAAGKPSEKQIAHGEITVAQLAAVYLKHAKAYYVKDDEVTAEYTNMIAALKPVVALHAAELAGDFGPRKMKAIRQTWISNGLARSTINSQVRRVARAFRWAASEELVPAAVPEALRTIEGLRQGRMGVKESNPVEVVSRAECRRDAAAPLAGRRRYGAVAA